MSNKSDYLSKRNIKNRANIILGSSENSGRMGDELKYTVIFDEYLCLKTETDIFMVIFQKFYFIFLMTPKMSPKSCAKPMASFSLWFPLKLTYLLLPHLLAKSKITFHGHLIVFLGGSGEMSMI